MRQSSNAFTEMCNSVCSSFDQMLVTLALELFTLRPVLNWHRAVTLEIEGFPILIDTHISGVFGLFGAGFGERTQASGTP
jgi:hypothetical protein